MVERVSWSYYDDERFQAVEALYLPGSGEGETMATQITTAIAKLVYKWYNDGDVYDTSAGMKGWLNDLSSYANWLAMYVDGAEEILNRIYTIESSDEDRDAQYEHILKDLVDNYNVMEFIVQFKDTPKVGTIYNCDGPYKFKECRDDDYDDDYDEEYNDEEEY